MRRAVLTVVALAAVACGGPNEVPVAERSAAPRPVAAADSGGQEQPAQATDGKPADTAADAGAADAADAGAADGKTAGGTAAQDSAELGSRKSVGPAKASQKRAQPGGKDDGSGPDMDAFDVSAVVEPACVRPGGTVTITVTTQPGAGVGYNAFYSDGKAGGPPPFGASYGGNHGGMAGEQGRYSDTWAVAANAPSGPGRVDVVSGLDGGYGQTSVPFAVADAVTGQCDQ